MLCFFLIKTTWFCSKCLNCTSKTHHRTALLECLPFKATFIEPAATTTDSIQLSDNPASPNFYPEFQEKTLLCEILIIQLLCNPSTLCVVDVWSWIVAHLPFIRGQMTHSHAHSKGLASLNPWTMSVQWADKWRLLRSEKSNQAAHDHGDVRWQSRNRAIILNKIYIDLAINLEES